MEQTPYLPIDKLLLYAEKGYSINQVSRKLNTYDITIRRAIKDLPELIQKFKENGKVRMYKGRNHNEPVHI